MSYRLEQALTDMGRAGAIFYPVLRCGRDADVTYRLTKGGIDYGVMQAYRMCLPEFLRWIAAGMPGLARCFECLCSSQCHNGVECKFPLFGPSPVLGSSPLTKKTSSQMAKLSAKTD